MSGMPGKGRVPSGTVAPRADAATCPASTPAGTSLDPPWPGADTPRHVWVHAPGAPTDHLSVETRVGVFVPASESGVKGTVLRLATDERGWSGHQSRRLPAGAVVPLTWSEGGHLMVSTATVVGWADVGSLIVAGIGTATVVQRRAYFRVRAELPAQVVLHPDVALPPEVIDTVTIDVGGGGCVLDFRWGARPAAGSPLAVVLWLPDGPVTAAAEVIRVDHECLRVRFRQLHTRDETRVVAFVQRRSVQAVH